jgi:uncharacterized protein (DUF58 family)
VKRRISKRTISITLVAGLLFLAATTAQAGWLFVIAASVLGLVAGSLFVRHHLSKLMIVRTNPRRSRVGDDIRVGLTITNPGRARSPLLRMEDRHAAYDPAKVIVEALGSKEAAHIELVRHLTRRGHFEGGEVVLFSGYPFGFVRTTRTIEITSEITVVPRWVELRSFPILEPSSSPSDVLHERARTGAGEQYLGVREYRPGDPPRSVHWRSTARAGKLIVREFEEEVASRVALVIAGDDVGTAPDSAYEMLIAAAASIGVYAIITGHPIEMLRPSSDGSPARISDPDRFAVLDWLARAAPGDFDLSTLATAALAGMGRRGTVVLLTTGQGRAANSVTDAVRTVQSAGSRAIVIATEPGGWRDGPSAALPADLGAGRAPLKLLERGGDLRRCLEG